MRASTVSSAISLLTVFAIVSKVGYFIQESAVAAIFGASGHVDALIAGRLVPTFVAGTLGSAVAMALIPLAVGQNAANRVRRQRLLRGAVILVTAVFGIGLIASLFYGTAIIGAFAPGFAYPQREEAAGLCSGAMLVGLFDCLGISLTALVQADRRFAIGILAGVLNPAIGIPMVILLGIRLGISGVLWGWGIGAAIQVIVLLVALRRPRDSHSLVEEQSAPSDRPTLRWASAILVCGVAMNVFVFVDRWICSSLSPGSIAIVNWAQKLMNVPLGLAVLPLATALYPFLSEQAHARDTAGIGRRVTLGVRAAMFVLVPAAILFSICSRDIVSAAFERGAFRLDDTIRTARVLRWYGIGLVFTGLVTVLIRVSYGLRDARGPLAAILVSTGLYIPVAITLSRAGGVSGIGQAYSLCMAVSVTILAVRLRSTLREVFSLQGLTEIVRLGAAGAVMVAGILLLRPAAGHGNRDGVPNLGFVAVELGISLAGYAIAAMAFRSTTAEDVLGLVIRRVRGLSVRWGAAAGRRVTE